MSHLIQGVWAPITFEVVHLFQLVQRYAVSIELIELIARRPLLAQFYMHTIELMKRVELVGLVELIELSELLEGPRAAPSPINQMQRCTSLH